MKASCIHGRVKSFKCILHTPAAPSSPHTWPFHLKSPLSSSPGMFSPLFAMSHIRCPTASPRRFTPCIPPSPSLYWFTRVCFRTFLSFILKTLRLPRNCYLCRACTARAMPAVENISCTPPGHQVKDAEAAPPKRPDYSVAA